MSLEKKRDREKKVVNLMIGLYCQKNHKGVSLCDNCSKLVDYSNTKLNNCPIMASKKFCSQCHIKCYDTEYKQKIKEVMKFAGPYMMFYHPFVTIKHGFYSLLRNK